MLDSKSPIDNRFTIQDYWGHQASEIVQAMGSGPQGLDADEAASRLVRYGLNTLREHRQHTITRLFLDRFRSPLLLILICKLKLISELAALRPEHSYGDMYYAAFFKSELSAMKVEYVLSDIGLPVLI
jgi:magnesium-transporting ATPase (P-type)